LAVNRWSKIPPRFGGKGIEITPDKLSEHTRMGPVSNVKPTIMFVDDEPRILKAIGRVVRREPYRALFAEGGEQALEKMGQTPVQVVVSDLNMPEMDGLTLLRTVRRDYPETVRIVLSAVTELDPILEAIHTGNIYRYITKPYEPRELVLILRQALNVWLDQKEKRDLQEQLAEQNRLLETRVQERTAQLLAMKRSAELGRYAAQIVHNLKGPMQAIVGYTSLAKMSLSGGEKNLDIAAEQLDRVESAADNLTRIVSGILQHAKNSDRFDNQWIQLNQVIEDELAFFDADNIFKYEVEKQIHLDETLPVIWVNPLHIQQIVDNLVHNALDAMENSQVKRLTLSTYPQENQICMSVADTGTGIDAQILPLIFQPDFTTKPLDKGTGLGLASVKTMTESYGGRIEVRPNDPHGAIFIVCLPVIGDR
jgi:two-component system sensor histidine kinase/response regulator